MLPFLRFHCGCSKMKDDLSFILAIYAALINIAHCTIFMQPKFRSQCWHLYATASSLFTWHQSEHIKHVDPFAWQQKHVDSPSSQCTQYTIWPICLSHNKTTNYTRTHLSLYLWLMWERQTDISTSRMYINFDGD